MSRISDILIDALSQHKFDEGNVGQFISFLEEDDIIRYQIWREMETQYRKNELLYRIDQYNQTHNTNVEFDDYTMVEMLDTFAEELDNCDEIGYISMAIAEKYCKDKVDGNE